MNVSNSDEYELLSPILKRLLSMRKSKQCPEYGRIMMRIHRKWWHRLVSRLIHPVTGWRCCGKEWLVLSKKSKGKRKKTVSPEKRQPLTDLEISRFP